MFGCSVCEYTSSKKVNVIRHINKIKSCGVGIKEIIEIPTEVKCEYCNKIFTITSNLLRHQKDNCKKKDLIKDIKITELEEKNKELKKKLHEHIL